MDGGIPIGLSTAGAGVAPVRLVPVRAALGLVREAAFRRLDQALLNDRFMLSGLKVWPVYDSLHNDLRYFSLLTKLGLN